MVESARSILTLVPVRGIIALLALATVVLFVLGCNDSSSTTTPPADVSSIDSSSTATSPAVVSDADGDTPSFLFVAQGSSGTLESVDGSEATFLLTIQGTAPTVIVFSDRPNRIAFDIPVSEFIDNWEAYGFIEDPPNAAAVLAEAEPEADVLIIELESPIWIEDTGTLIFEARALGAEAVSAGLRLHSSKADDRLPDSFAHMSLFIDSTGTCVIPPATNCSGADLHGGDYRGADLNRADLSRADLSGAHLSKADLSDANLGRANLSKADLSDASLSLAELTEAELGGAILIRADLSHADLSDANLNGAKLNGADLSGSNINCGSARKS